MKFKKGDIVRILYKDTTFGWDNRMTNMIGKQYKLEQDWFSLAYEGWYIDGWVWSENALELTQEDNETNITYTEEEIKMVYEASMTKTWEHFTRGLSKIKDPDYKKYLQLKSIYES